MRTYLKFSKELWQKIDSAIDSALKLDPHPVAVFDADGTLWDTDLGESFFKYEIKHNLLKNLPPDPWKHYRTWKESGDPRPAYLWLAQIHQGLKLSQVKQWAELAVKDFEPLPIFEDQQTLVDKLIKSGIDVYVVTASVKWAVEPGSALLGIPARNVLGVETDVSDGLISNQGILPITYREGKIEALLKATKGKIPFLACGNTMGDSSLLLAATTISLAVGAASEDNELFAAEDKLRDLAKQKSWPIHRF